MKVLHLTRSTNGYEEVELVHTHVSKTNKLALIERNGVEYMTGGFLIHDEPEIRKVLDSMPRSEQYDFVLLIRQTPFVFSLE